MVWELAELAPCTAAVAGRGSPGCAPVGVCMPTAHPLTHPDALLSRDYFSFTGQAVFKGNFHYTCQTALI